MFPGKFRLAIALDGGTTNTRARLLRDGQVVATSRRSVGVRDSVLSAGRTGLAMAVRDALAEVVRAADGHAPEVIVAAGMLSSEVGLAAVPHVLAPAGPRELARAAVVRHLPEVADQPILFIPGVRTPPSEGRDGWADADLMRGEECETLGAWSLFSESDRQAGRGESIPVTANTSRTVFLWPGSHTKAVEVDAEGRILRSYTSLAGELTGALAGHTLLAASLPEHLPDDPDLDAVAAGARLVTRSGLGRAAFLVRIAALGGALDAHERASFLVGAVIADDVANLVRQPILDAPARIWVGGRQPQRSLYARWLREQLEAPVLELDDDVANRASAMGALAVAAHHRDEELR
ncbi:2-keto-3-deoxygalactonate kinase [Singulisphaera sp. GP187]|uniref:2-dehydro-3-deoxygalactonokinase n=1 Tax=Singulisphaera sp. GP187 TaxID=1882752 RepID=UPI0009260B98|nr:2-dehydro-3-deoxygalactonokinase [Singulisphaera sp. GP187]SIN84589.1 2-keto-3-deoxygalactonate kinase [Singulisphaera sp. GP187]